MGSTSTRENRTKGWWNLPYPEYVKRREEGICFQCGGPYSPGHKCPDKNLRVLILGRIKRKRSLKKKKIRTIRDQLPDFHLEDKVVWNLGSIDKTFKVYVRKKVQN